MPQNQLNVPLIHATTTKKCWQVIHDGSEDICFETQTPNDLEHDYVVKNRVKKVITERESQISTLENKLSQQLPSLLKK